MRPFGIPSASRIADTAEPVPNYLTPAGAKQLADELQRLMSVERPKVVREVAEAAAQGDRSENAEYIYGKKRLREIDRRVQELSKRLESLEVLDARRVNHRVPRRSRAARNGLR